MNIIPKAEVIRRLNMIYAKVPSFECKHCLKCSNPIWWFKPEEINIREYLKQHHMQYRTYSFEEFKMNHMRCPYLQDNRCSIYPVRPMVCRLQGTIKELPCPYIKKPLLTEEKYKKIVYELNMLTKDLDALGEYFGTRKMLNSTIVSAQSE